ncbi:MAG: hypothetical protein ACYDAC_12625 [Candidatus Dormibacteria bacterium]
MARDEAHLEAELALLRAGVGAYREPRRLPTEPEFPELAGHWARNVWWALRMVKRLSVTDDECRILGEEMARLYIEATQEEAEHEAQRRRRERIQDEVCQRLSSGATKAVAAVGAGISRDTLNDWERKDPLFHRRVRQALAEGIQRRPPRHVPPRKVRPSVLSAITTALASGMTRTEAAASAGISKQTLYAWLRRAPEFRREVVEAEQRALRAWAGRLGS